MSETPIETAIAAKPWWQSKTLWGAVIAAFAPLATLAGVQIDQDAMAGTLAAIGSLVGSALAIYGRVKAELPIRRVGSAAR